MNKNQVVPLAESIEHWYENWLNATQGLHISVRPIDCACCRDRRLNASEGVWRYKCEGCPVYEDTKAADCFHTPYYDAYKLRNTPGNELIAACEAEYQYLVGLMRVI